MNTTNQHPKKKANTMRRSTVDLEHKKPAAVMRLAKASDKSDELLTRQAESDPDNLPVLEDDLKSGALKIVHRHPKPNKISLTIRLDEDLIAWFKDQGENGYQTRINEALRSYRAQVETETDNPNKALDKIESLLKDVRRKVA